MYILTCVQVYRCNTLDILEYNHCSVQLHPQCRATVLFIPSVYYCVFQPTLYCTSCSYTAPVVTGPPHAAVEHAALTGHEGGVGAVALAWGIQGARSKWGKCRSRTNVEE